MENTYSISTNTVINIDFIGMAIDATLIDVIPHIVHNAELQFSGMIASVVINKESDYLKNGGKFITHIPKVEIIDK